ncbi:RDD family protein [Sphingomonas sp. LHG3406-1]|uniref:RDD family protein n=1 Tax=Sphingomonas sp. LHG3406-1 TaxID=2804617 RepID=UPI002639FD77|nr:RDD family protein [Sphingomonas sp. LHG3406-1]
MKRRSKRPGGLRRRFVTPEGVDLQLELASGGARAGAFVIDALIMIVILIGVTLFLLYIGVQEMPEALGILWLIGFFLLRNFWFSLFEMGRRGATPGKRLAGLRVVARDGSRLTGAAVVARNAMREIEVFLPLSFLGMQAAQGVANTFLTLFALTWSGIFLFFPLFNRDRLRVGDLVAGTWVVEVRKTTLSYDLVGAAPRQRRKFPEEALAAYGIYELQRLEHVLRAEQPIAVSTVAATIRDKFGIPSDGDDYGFLSDFYAELCARLEQNMLFGRKRESKHDA